MYNPNPLPIDAYSRYMARMFDERPVIGNPTLFQSFFGRAEGGGGTLYSPDANLIQIDIIRGNQELAQTVLRGVSGDDLSRKKKKEGKFTTVARNFPLIEEEAIIHSDQLNDRISGEPVYNSPMSKFDRLRTKAFNLHADLMRRVIRTFEYLAAQSIITGKQPQIIGTVDTNLIYDFLRNAGNTIAVSIPWTTAATAVPIDNLDAGCVQMRSKGHVTPDICLMGSSSYAAFLKTVQVTDLGKSMQILLLGITQAPIMPARFQWLIDAGAQYMGSIRTYKGFDLAILTYQDIYQNSAGADTFYMPVDKTILAYSGARCDRYFGPSEMLPMTGQRAQWYIETFGIDPRTIVAPQGVKNPGVIDPSMFYFDGYQSPDNKSVTIRTQAAPIFAPTMTDAFVTLTGCV